MTLKLAILNMSFQSGKNCNPIKGLDDEHLRRYLMVFLQCVSDESNDDDDPSPSAISVLFSLFRDGLKDSCLMRSSTSCGDKLLSPVSSLQVD